MQASGTASRWTCATGRRGTSPCAAAARRPAIACSTSCAGSVPPLPQIQLHADQVLRLAAERADLLRADAHELAVLDLRDDAARARQLGTDVGGPPHPVRIEVVRRAQLVE